MLPLPQSITYLATSITTTIQRRTEHLAFVPIVASSLHTAKFIFIENKTVQVPKRTKRTAIYLSTTASIPERGLTLYLPFVNHRILHQAVTFLKKNCPCPN